MSPKPTESGVVLCCCRKENVMVWRWMDEGVNCWMCGRPVCRQTDRQTGGGWSQSGWRTDSARWRRRGDGWPDLQSPLFLFIYLFFKPSPPLTRFPRRSSNLLHKKDKPLVLSSASPRAEKMDAVFKKKRKGNAWRSRHRRIEYEDALKWGSEEVRSLVCGRRRQDLQAWSSIVEFLVTLVLTNKLLH